MITFALLQDFGKAKVIIDKEKMPVYDENDPNERYLHCAEVGDLKLLKQSILRLDKKILETSDVVDELKDVAEHLLNETHRPEI